MCSRFLIQWIVRVSSARPTILMLLPSPSCRKPIQSTFHISTVRIGRATLVVRIILERDSGWENPLVHLTVVPVIPRGVSPNYPLVYPPFISTLGFHDHVGYPTATFRLCP